MCGEGVKFSSEAVGAALTCSGVLKHAKGNSALALVFFSREQSCLAASSAGILKQLQLNELGSTCTCVVPFTWSLIDQLKVIE